MEGVWQYSQLVLCYIQKARAACESGRIDHRLIKPLFLFTWSGDKNKPAIMATQHACADPYPTMVEFDRPVDGFIRLTSRVLLYRCVGDCPGTHEFQNCTVTNQEEVVLKVLDSQGTFRNTTVYNHTKCGCACKTRKSDCDKNIHVYSSRSCSCECKQGLRKSCNSAIQTYNRVTCKCECKSAPKHCDSNSNQEWNPNICDCDCSQRVKDRCVRKGKALNKSTCECECPKPLPTCPVGTTFLKYNCTCVDTSVSTKWRSIMKAPSETY